MLERAGEVSVPDGDLKPVDTVPGDGLEPGDDTVVKGTVANFDPRMMVCL